MTLIALVPRPGRRGSALAPAAPVSIETTVVVPTSRGGGAGARALVFQLASVFAGHSLEVVFVDDSDDDTPLEIARVARSFAPTLDVHLLQRSAAQRGGGPDGAVAEGIGRARGEFVVVLQEVDPDGARVADGLVDAIVHEGVDLVVATRAADDLADDVAALALPTRGSTPAQARAVFLHSAQAYGPARGPAPFVVRRSSVDPSRLRPSGLGILLEILATHALDVSEMPLPEEGAVEEAVNLPRRDVPRPLRFVALGLAALGVNVLVVPPLLGLERAQVAVLAFATQMAVGAWFVLPVWRRSEGPDLAVDDALEPAQGPADVEDQSPEPVAALPGFIPRQRVAQHDVVIDLTDRRPQYSPLTTK